MAGQKMKEGMSKGGMSWQDRKRKEECHGRTENGGMSWQDRK